MEQKSLRKKILTKKSYYATKTYNIIEYKPNFSYIIPTLFKPKYLFKIRKKFSKFLIQTSNPYHLFTRQSFKSLRSYAILGIGGNKGNVLETFWRLFNKLKNRNTIICHSPFLKNPAFGYTQQANFYNGIIWIKTNLCPIDFFSYCMYLERIFKRERKRAFKNAPRTLDIDILGFKNKKITLHQLRIPHKEWSKRESVLIPLKGLQ
ncbi:2-amino-4-hydroxy-6-hydroxymethyldihydropteridine diphosphokinase [Helicobacter mesocricetorum]|uniref:2-amino-4-hydroxy-6- hydroxymethyldihydropteridine diphosphokinase n=1 Tax=Helicobacter mesocricetorum TaxID=87012 RepID=UPI000CF14624|nr:2-amino-4-hydroxy-6-hydroxymethyldihydropteridine diphosphokinase [Helicobacter mesocricetorum]